MPSSNIDHLKKLLEENTETIGVYKEKIMANLTTFSAEKIERFIKLLEKIGGRTKRIENGQSEEVFEEISMEKSLEESQKKTMKLKQMHSEEKNEKKRDMQKLNQLLDELMNP